jgi:heptosyltransferase-2
MVISEHCSEIMKFNPRIDNLHIINTKQGTVQVLKQWRTLKRTMPKYDMAIDVHDSLRSKFMRIGLAKNLFIYDSARSYKRNLIKFKTRIPDESIIPVPLRYFSAFNELSPVRPDEQGLEYWLETDQAQMKYPLERVSEPTCILIAPGARHATKRWPPEFYADLIHLLNKWHDAQVMLIGGPDDKTLCDVIQEMVGTTVQNRAGSMSLHQIASLMDSAHCVIGNDSGLMHVAAARHIPVLTIYGSTVPEFGFAPYKTRHEIVTINLPCKPCTHIGKEKCPLGHFSCMKDISPLMVFNQVQSLLTIKDQ